MVFSIKSVIAQTKCSYSASSKQARWMTDEFHWTARWFQIFWDTQRFSGAASFWTEFWLILIGFKINITPSQNTSSPSFTSMAKTKITQHWYERRRLNMWSGSHSPIQSYSYGLILNSVRLRPISYV